MTVHLDDDLQAFVASLARRSAAGDESEVVRAALRLLEAHTRLTSSELDDARELIREGVRQLDHGEGKPWSSEEVWRLVQDRRRG